MAFLSSRVHPFNLKFHVKRVFKIAPHARLMSCEEKKYFFHQRESIQNKREYIYRFVCFYYNVDVLIRA